MTTPMGVSTAGASPRDWIVSQEQVQATSEKLAQPELVAALYEAASCGAKPASKSSGNSAEEQLREALASARPGPNSSSD